MSVTVVVTDEERWVGLRFKAMSLAEGSRLEILGVVYESARGELPELVAVATRRRRFFFVLLIMFSVLLCSMRAIIGSPDKKKKESRGRICPDGREGG
jgi:hypothetical protein